MAKFDYSKMQKVASNLLDQFGNYFTLRKLVGKEYDPSTKKQVNVYEDYSGVCVKKIYTAEMIGALTNIINVGDVSFVCTMFDKSVVPTEGKDKIVYGDIEYNILKLASSEPNGKNTIVHTVYARRAS